jgi:hypothetical protein
MKTFKVNWFRKGSHVHATAYVRTGSGYASIGQLCMRPHEWESFVLNFWADFEEVIYVA